MDFPSDREAFVFTGCEQMALGRDLDFVITGHGFEVALFGNIKSSADQAVHLALTSKYRVKGNDI